MTARYIADLELISHAISCLTLLLSIGILSITALKLAKRGKKAKKD